MYSTPYYCQILKKLEFSGQNFEKYSNIKFRENPSSGRRVIPYGWTDGRTDKLIDMTKLIVTYRTVPNVPKNLWTPLQHRARFDSGITRAKIISIFVVLI